MFEEMTYEKLLADMTAHMSSELDKREGSVVWDMLSPMALELAEHYAQLGQLLELLFLESSSGEYLDRLGAQFGIPRKEAQCAVLKGEFTDENNQPAQVEAGSRFRWGELAYTVGEQLEAGIYAMTCEQPGAEGNSAVGDILPVVNLPGLKSAVLSGVLQEGCDRESDDEYRQRAMGLVARPAFGGNVSSYEEEGKNIPGVGWVKVFPVFNGGGTVGLVLGDFRGRAVTQTVLEEAQAHFASGDEQSMAPIGHQVTVKNCQEKQVEIALTATLDSNAVAEEVDAAIQQAVAAYVDGIDFLEKRVFLAKVVAAALEVDGVTDVPVNSVTINGASENLVLQKDMTLFEVPVCAGVTVGR